MNEMIIGWLSAQGISQAYLPIAAQLIGLTIIFIVLFVSYYIAKHQFVTIIHTLLTNSQNKWDDLLIEHKVFFRLALLLPFILLLFLAPFLTAEDSLLEYCLIVVAKVGIAFQVAASISATLSVINSLYQQKAHKRYLPLNATVQVIKLIVYLVASILAISFILDRSPVYLLSGLGALTAVLLLVFQDTIKGLVASIQISANRMVAPGDWIELPKYGADGDVMEIGLNTVKVRNFDRTVTTVPTYALISESFKNWRDMYNSNGRRIKRCIYVDISSIEFLSNDQIEEFKHIALINQYLNDKQTSIKQTTDNGETPIINQRQLTNIGTFRAYIEAYLKNHAHVQLTMTCMVRQLAPTPTGVPLELYFFSKEQEWVQYEGIQADIFDHIFAIAPHFGLRIFQHPSGYDWSISK